MKSINKCDDDCCDEEGETEETGLYIPDNSNTNLLDYNILKFTGAINERSAEYITSSLLLLLSRNMETKNRILEQLKDAPEEEVEKLKRELSPNIEFMLSTYGGEALECFAIYDVMNMVKRQCTLSTVGFGKIMSAGVLLLAAGTKGERSVTPNCHLMIHAISAGSEGRLQDIENEISQVKALQESYIDCLSRATSGKLSKKLIKKFLLESKNKYLTAEEAVYYGIADKII
jgi:ATP-dependent Clp protease protease subunit